MRERLYHDLTIVTGVRKRLLITGHAGCENDLPTGRADRAVRLTHIHLSVFENENGILRVKHHGFGIILVHQNPLSRRFGRLPIHLNGIRISADSAEQTVDECR